jgi:hypothetical protein
MAVNVNEKFRRLSVTERERVDARVSDLIAEVTSRELEKAGKLTQVRVAKAPGNTQDRVSRLKKR